MPELNTEVFRVTPLPRFLVKKPLFRPTRAGAWVMLARKPSRRVTEAWLWLAAYAEEDEDEEPDDPHPTARAVTAAAPAASKTRRMGYHLVSRLSRSV